MYASRRQLLKKLLVAGVAAVLNGCASQNTTKPAPEVIEITRIIQQTVEVIKVVTNTPTPTEEKNGMIWYVDIEHQKKVEDPALAPNFDKVRKERTWVVGNAAAMDSESIHYWQVTRELARQRNVRALCISGNTADWVEYDFATFQPLFDLVKSGEIPTIGFCGGHQLIGLMYDAPCDAIRKLNPGEPDLAEWAPGWFKEVGYLPVQVVQADPIFAGLGETPEFFESHYWEIKELPAQFDLLASTENVRVQCIRHKEHLIYGTQFHPEVNDAAHRDGLALLRNFFTIAGIRKA